MSPLELVLINGIRPGGTTKPLDVLAINEAGQTGKYLAKSFRNKSPNPFHTAKEIIGAEVAKILDLPTPSYGIIQIDDSDLNSHYPANDVLNLIKGI